MSKFVFPPRNWPSWSTCTLEIISWKPFHIFQKVFAAYIYRYIKITNIYLKYCVMFIPSLLWKKNNSVQYFYFPKNNNITDVNKDTFCRSNDTYYLRLSLSEVRLDGNPVVLSKYPDSFVCMKVLPVGKYRWGNRTPITTPIMELFLLRLCERVTDIFKIFGALVPL